MKLTEGAFKAMKYSWIILGAIGTMAGVFALLTTPITLPIKVLLAVGGEAIIACFLMIPYWLQKDKTLELENQYNIYKSHQDSFNKMQEQYLYQERTKVEVLKKVVSQYKQKFGELK